LAEQAYHKHAGRDRGGDQQHKQNYESSTQRSEHEVSRNAVPPPCGVSQCRLVSEIKTPSTRVQYRRTIALTGQPVLRGYGGRIFFRLSAKANPRKRLARAGWVRSGLQASHNESGYEGRATASAPGLSRRITATAIAALLGGPMTPSCRNSQIVTAEAPARIAPARRRSLSLSMKRAAENACQEIP